MSNKTPQTKLEIELFCDKVILLEENQKLRIHLQALQEVLKTAKFTTTQFSKPSSKKSFKDSL